MARRRSSTRQHRDLNIIWEEENTQWRQSRIGPLRTNISFSGGYPYSHITGHELYPA